MLANFWYRNNLIPFLISLFDFLLCLYWLLFLIPPINFCDSIFLKFNSLFFEFSLHSYLEKIILYVRYPLCLSYFPKFTFLVKVLVLYFQISTSTMFSLFLFILYSLITNYVFICNACSIGLTYLYAVYLLCFFLLDMILISALDSIVMFVPDA